MEVAILTSDLDSNLSSSDSAPSFLDDATVSSQTNSVTSTRTPVSKPRSGTHLPRSPPHSDVGATVTAAESASGRVSIKEIMVALFYDNTQYVPSWQRIQAPGSSVCFQRWCERVSFSIHSARALDSTLWSKCQFFDANLDPCFGFRADVLARMVHDAEHTPLKQLGRRNVGSTLRHQLAPFFHHAIDVSGGRLWGSDFT